jgi:uncharacterized membrane protein
MFSRRRSTMSEDTFIAYGGTYATVDAAEADYKAVKALYYDLDAVDTFDAAVIRKKENGKVKIVKKHEQPTRQGGWAGAGWGLATGLVIALFPGAAIGAGLLATTTGAGAALGALGGHVAGGMSRRNLKALGDLLDAGESGLVVIAATDVAGRVAAVMQSAQNVVQADLKADVKDLNKDMEEAAKEEKKAEKKIEKAVS